MKTDTIAVYVRVSTQEQAKEGYSVDEQRDRLRKYCEAHDWKLVKEYVDPGFSGAKLERPAITQLIKDVKEKKISRVLVYKLDRLSRSQKDTLYLIEDVFLANGTEFVSMTENFDTSTPFGKAMIGILSVFAQLEREQIKERMSMGKEGRAKEGKFHGSNKTPIGYRYDEGRLLVDPYEANIVKTCFNMYASGASVERIYADMKKAGMQSSYGPLTKPTIYFMLHNKTYLGILKHRDQEYEGLHEALIDQKTFNRCQERFERNRNNPRYANSFKHTTVLGNFLKCGCGCSMRVRYGWKKKNGEYTKYYICKTNVTGGEKCPISNKGYLIDEVQKAVFKKIKELKLDPKAFVDAIKAMREQEEENREDPQIAIMQSRIAEIDKQIEKLIRLYTVKNIDFDIITSQIEELTTEKAKLSQEIEERTEPEEEARTDNLGIEDIKDALDLLNDEDLSLDRILADPEDDKIKNVLELLINQIIITKGVIDIRWNF